MELIENNLIILSYHNELQSTVLSNAQKESVRGEEVGRGNF